ncbi:uncharacterized protein LOC131049705 isoform X1 [Cryptomeria japonica]|uniref:uncharacterized protein LOC131049705 isoform X1 n=1 Tax=Cryptomeria japonica TaxID=3369 RepID=UPI0027DA8F40|nr:uncharacterized protein LOC131049705 isoform X1 [Cryptomeria japonica]
MTVTMNISNTLVDTFLPRLTIGSGIRICNFTIKNKSQCESGDADCCIALTTKSTFETIPFVCTEHKLAPDFTISQLSEAHCHYSVGSFGAIGTSYHLTKTHLEVHIKDGDLQEDMATVLISTTYTELCATLQQLFSIVDMPFILFKNIVRNGPQGTRSFRPSQSTFIEELNDQCTKAHLETLAKCNIQVVGVLKAKNAYFPPYEISCSMCHHSLPFDAAIDMDFVHCTYCNTDTQTSCHHNILCTLNTQEGNIDCSLQGDILQQTYPDITRYNIRTIPTKHLANGLYVAQAPPLWHVHISCEQHHY